MTENGFVDEVSDGLRCDRQRAESVIFAVFRELSHRLTAPEAADVASQLPAGLKRLWSSGGEIDRPDQGWSVAVHGFGRDITHAVDPESGRLRQLPVQPWAPGRRDQWFKITPTEITGRRLTAAGAGSPDT